MNHYRGYAMKDIQKFAKQIFEGINFIHKLGIIHTDLKPENILLKDSSYEKKSKRVEWPKHIIIKEKNKRENSEQSTKSYFSNEKEIYYKLKNNDIKIIDFGSAVFVNEHCEGIINTRQYRAPEVILECCKWNEKSDIWSIACILIELYCGELLFATHDNIEHLCLIEKVCGFFPKWMIRNTKDLSLKNLFNINESSDKCKIYFFIINQKKIKSALHEQLTLRDIILNKDKVFCDFLEFLLQIEPDKRPSCEEALKHNFFKVSFDD